LVVSPDSMTLPSSLAIERNVASCGTARVVLVVVETGLVEVLVELVVLVLEEELVDVELVVLVLEEVLVDVVVLVLVVEELLLVLVEVDVVVEPAAGSQASPRSSWSVSSCSGFTCIGQLSSPSRTPSVSRSPPSRGPEPSGAQRNERLLSAAVRSAVASMGGSARRSVVHRPLKRW
jgi:hypothetical protein